MIKKIKYYEIISDHLLVSPQFKRSELVEYDDEQKLEDYIATKRDHYKNKYKKSNFARFDYISGQGGIKIVNYIEHQIIKL